MTEYYRSDTIAAGFVPENEMSVDFSILAEPSLAEVQEAHEAALQSFDDHNHKTWWYGLNRIGMFGDEAAEWIIVDWMPRAIEKGLKQVAVFVARGKAQDPEVTAFPVKLEGLKLRAKASSDIMDIVMWLQEG